MASYVPSIWDYIGQAGMTGVDRYSAARQDALDRAERDAVRKREQALQMFQMLFGAGMSGAANVADVNANPIAQEFGINLVPAPRELARRIAAVPGGSPEVTGMLPTPAGPVPTMRVTPWSDDQRRVAGMPTQDQMDVERGAGAEGRARVTQTKYEAMSPELTAAAQRYVSEVLGPNFAADPRQFAALAGTAADKAYQQWLTDQRAQGNLSVDDPGVRNYARTFFANAVSDAMRKAEELRLMGARSSYYMGGGSDDPTRWYRAVQTTVANLSQERERLLKPYADLLQYGEVGTRMLEKDPVFMQQVKPQIDAIDARLNAAKTIQNSLLQGVVPDNLQEVLGGGAATPAPAEGAGAPTSNAQPLSPAQMDMLVQSLGQAAMGNKELAQRQFEVRKRFLTPQDAATLASRTGLKP